MSLITSIFCVYDSNHEKYFASLEYKLDKSGLDFDGDSIREGSGLILGGYKQDQIFRVSCL